MKNLIIALLILFSACKAADQKTDRPDTYQVVVHFLDGEVKEYFVKHDHYPSLRSDGILKVNGRWVCYVKYIDVTVVE